MTQYDNTNKGVLFREQNKKSEKHPDMTGEINVDGVEFRLAGWTKQSKAGRNFLSLSITPKQEQAAASQAPAEDFNDSIPF
ncbi:hypothetical protein [Spiribacter onubensis]|uniref:DUF736 domain-containing protein n=1 Tax=Spiribacter onubensis TaxID=3122420 RepID=A0ABV3S6S5_9GAMM